MGHTLLTPNVVETGSSPTASPPTPIVLQLLECGGGTDLPLDPEGA